MAIQGTAPHDIGQQIAAGIYEPMTGTFYTNACDAPSLPCAYVLAIEITKPVTVKLPGEPASH